MRKFFVLTFALLCLVAAKAQQDTSVVGFDAMQRTVVHSSVEFGRGVFGENYAMSSIGVDYSRKVNDRVAFFGGVSLFDMSFTPQPVDLAPRNKKAMQVYAGASYKASDKFIFSGSVFYNGLFNEAGANIDMVYRFTENSYLEFSATFVHPLNTSDCHYPVPYGYYNIFHP